MPSASSTIAVVESRRRGDRRHGEWRSLQGESPFVCVSISSSWYAWSITRLYGCWFVTAVPCRQRAPHSPQRRGDHRHGERQSLRGGASFVCICVGGSRLLALFGAKTLLASSSLNAWPMTRLYAYCLATAVPCRQLAAQSPFVVESQRQGDRRRGGRRSLKGESPFVCKS